MSNKHPNTSLMLNFLKVYCFIISLSKKLFKKVIKINGIHVPYRGFDCEAYVDSIYRFNIKKKCHIKKIILVFFVDSQRSFYIFYVFFFNLH